MITVSGFTAGYVLYRQNSTLNALMCGSLALTQLILHWTDSPSLHMACYIVDSLHGVSSCYIDKIVLQIKL